MQQVTFRVNGTPTGVDVGDEALLIDHLRDTLDLKGTRFGCGEEQCGACLVMVDSKATPSCQLEIGNLASRRVETIEAIRETPEGRRLVASFIRFQAAQCGFCLSGILVRAYEYLVGGGRADRAAIAKMLAPQLCRCGAHPRMLAAVEAACAEAAEEGP